MNSQNTKWSKITDKIPQRYPFLMVDDIICISKDKIRTKKAVSYGDYMLSSGTFFLENMAQSASALLGGGDKKYDNMYLASIDSAKIMRVPRAGERIETEVVIVVAAGSLIRVSAVSYGADSEKLAEAVMVLYAS